MYQPRFIRDDTLDSGWRIFENVDHAFEILLSLGSIQHETFAVV